MKPLNFLVEITDGHLSIWEQVKLSNDVIQVGNQLLYVSMACPSASEALQETIWNRYIEEDENNV